MKLLPRNGFPMIEGIGFKINWDGPERIRRVHYGRDSWWWQFNKGIRRHKRDEPGLFLQPFWNPFIWIRVLGLFIGVGICVSWPHREV